jgi:hypothetical protein
MIAPIVAYEISPTRQEKQKLMYSYYLQKRWESNDFESGNNR